MKGQAKMEADDEQLMQKFAEGDARALAEIYGRYKLRILNFCLRFLGNRSEAEDVTGEVFLALFSGTYTPQSQAKFSTWLFTIARNRCIDCLRLKKRTVSTTREGQEEFEFGTDAPDSRRQLEAGETAGAVKAAVMRLPEEQREAIILREYNKFSYQEIAGILGCSLQKVKILIFRAREHLRGELASIIQEGHHEG